MAQKAFYFDGTRCTGCKTCELACKDKKDLSAEIAYRKVYDYEGGDCSKAANGTLTSTCFAYHLSMACNHCTSPACVANCPQKAVHKDADTGLVLPNDEKCIGCGTCAKSCPYNVPMVNPDTKKMVKCDGCYDRVTKDKQPICVEACPVRALDFGDAETIKGKYGTGNGSIAPMPESKTEPNIVIKASASAKPVGDTTGFIANPAEVASVS